MPASSYPDLHKRQRLMPPPQTCFVFLEQPFYSFQQKLVNRVYLILRRVFAFLSLDHLSNDHCDVRTPRDWKVEAAIRKEDGNLQLPADRLRRAERNVFSFSCHSSLSLSSSRSLTFMIPHLSYQALNTLVLPTE